MILADRIFDWAELAVGAICAAIGWGAKELRARRRRSGSVATSDADALWEESRQIREFLSGQVDTLHQSIAAANKRIDVLTDSNDGLRVQLEAAQQLAERLREERERLTLERERLTAEVGRLTDANTALDRMNRELTTKVAHLTELLEHHEIETPDGG